MRHIIAIIFYFGLLMGIVFIGINILEIFAITSVWWHMLMGGTVGWFYGKILPSGKFFNLLKL